MTKNSLLIWVLAVLTAVCIPGVVEARGPYDNPETTQDEYQIQTEPAPISQARPDQPEQAMAEVPSDMKQASGEIKEVNADQNRVALKRTPLGPTSNFEVDLGAAITDGAKPINLSELQKGDSVDIDYFVREGKNVARSITVNKKAGS